MRLCGAGGSVSTGLAAVQLLLTQACTPWGLHCILYQLTIRYPPVCCCTASIKVHDASGLHHPQGCAGVLRMWLQRFLVCCHQFWCWAGLGMTWARALRHSGVLCVIGESHGSRAVVVCVLGAPSCVYTGWSYLVSACQRVMLMLTVTGVSMTVCCSQLGQSRLLCLVFSGWLSTCCLLASQVLGVHTCFDLAQCLSVVWHGKWFAVLVLRTWW